MRRISLGLSILLLGASCESSCWMNDYSFVRRGRLVTVYGYGVSESDACAGSFEEIDSHTDSIRRFLGIDEPPRYTFRWFSDDSWTEIAPCSTSAFACAPRGEGRSRTLPDMHEALHMVTHGLDCPSVLDEGLAEIFDGPTPWEWYPSASDDITPLLVDEWIPRTLDAYALAGHFASFLVERFGGPAVARLCRALPRKSTSAHWDAAARKVLDRSLDQVLAEYATYPVCSSEQIRARLWVCDGKPDFVFSPEDGTFTVDAGCLDPRATNAAWGDVGDAVIHRLVYFPEDAWVEVSARSVGTSGKGATFVSQECAPCSADPQMLVGLDDVDLQFYRAGFHEVSVFFDRRDTISLTMKRIL
jgi:hypothetical protein